MTTQDEYRVGDRVRAHPAGGLPLEGTVERVSTRKFKFPILVKLDLGAARGFAPDELEKILPPTPAEILNEQIKQHRQNP